MRGASHASMLTAITSRRLAATIARRCAVSYTSSGNEQQLRIENNIAMKLCAGIQDAPSDAPGAGRRDTGSAAQAVRCLLYCANSDNEQHLRLEKKRRDEA